MPTDYYSVRMRAATGGPHEQGGKHISGGETLSTYEKIDREISSLVKKALAHSRGTPDFMQIQLEKVEQTITTLSPLSIATNHVLTPQEGHLTARDLLQKSGVPLQAIEYAYQMIDEEPTVRGACLIDIYTGKRIDQRRDSGVRVSRMAWQENSYQKWITDLMIDNNIRLKEAISLATKVASHGGTIAELCWSDDPDYVTGYVASKMVGYQRITSLKEFGDESGCRVFFVDLEKEEDRKSYINYLEKEPVLLKWE
ncbi:6-carboxyhexanoate--CoA ligase [Jeotgalibacillus marinus]|uniref:6-carboxyhexanoate--CoA ligase n=1 Tax=Jeotgalibacillus marinus TaxID=86667 RepID=A0ABV3Q352_9BACL